VGPRAVVDAVMKTKIPSRRRESNPTTPVAQPVASAISTELSILKLILKVGTEGVDSMHLAQGGTSGMLL
jgi:hypothetical protein